MHLDNEQKVFTVVHDSIISDFAFSFFDFLGSILNIKLLLLFWQMETSTQIIFSGLYQNASVDLVLKLMGVVFWEIWLERATLPRREVFNFFVSSS